MRGQLWSREELMEKYGIPEGDQKDDDDDDDGDVAKGSGVPPPVPTQRGGQGHSVAGTGSLAVAWQSAGQGLQAAAARARGLLAAAGKVRHAWQDTKWARDLWRALRRRQQTRGEPAEQEL